MSIRHEQSAEVQAKGEALRQSSSAASSTQQDRNLNRRRLPNEQPFALKTKLISVGFVLLAIFLSWASYRIGSHPISLNPLALFRSSPVEDASLAASSAAMPEETLSPEEALVKKIKALKDAGIEPQDLQNLLMGQLGAELDPNAQTKDRSGPAAETQGATDESIAREEQVAAEAQVEADAAAAPGIMNVIAAFMDDGDLDAQDDSSAAMDVVDALGGAASMVRNADEEGQTTTVQQVVTSTQVVDASEVVPTVV